MSYISSKELMEERAKIVSEIQATAVKVKSEGREMTAEEEERHDRLFTQQKELQVKLSTANRVEQAEQLQEDRSKPRFVEVSDKVETRLPRGMITSEERELAFRAWAIKQAGSEPSRSFDEAAQKCGIDYRQGSYQFEFPQLKDWWREQRGSGQSEGTWPQNSTAGSAGGFLAEQSSLIPDVDIALKYYANMRKVCKVIRTATGEVNWNPTIDDSTNTASVHSELAASDETDVAVSHQKVPVFLYDTGVYPISVELLQDARFPIIQIFSDLCGIRIGRKSNTDFTVGDNSGNQPLGIKTDVNSNGNTFTTASSGTCVYADCVGCIYGLDRAYRELPSAGFVCSDSFIKNAWSLVDSQNRPLMNMSMDLIDPRDRLLGFPLFANNDLDTVAAGNTPAIFGAWEKATVRDAMDLNIRILQESLMTTYGPGSVGILAWMRTGFKCINPKAFIQLKIHS